MEKDRNTPRWRNTIPRFVWAIVIVFTLILAGGITYGVRHARDHATRPAQQLVTITFDASFIRQVKLTPKQFAKTFHTMLSVKTKKSYPTKNGAVIMEVTPAQRTRMIRNGKEFLSTVSAPFLNDNPKYHYKVSPDYKRIDIWMDETASMEAYLAIIGGVPNVYGFLYYITGHTGPWDMTTTIYNCNTGKRKLTFSYWKQPRITWPLKILK